MKILVDNGCYDLLNCGDVSMLQVLVDRLKEFWPGALIYVVTDAPERLKSICPDDHAIDPFCIESWNKVGPLSKSLFRYIPRIEKGFIFVEYMTWKLCPSLFKKIIKIKANRRNINVDVDSIEAFISIIFSADLVIASGGGYMTDSFKYISFKILDTLKFASQLGIKTAMFSQGIGPIHDSELSYTAKKVFPLIDMIAVREKLFSPSILKSLNVDAQKIFLTGDDSIELAFNRRSITLGNGIGINLRIASYSNIAKKLITIIQTVLHNFAKKFNAPLIPVPISMYHKESDIRTIKKLLRLNGNAPNNFDKISKPSEVIDQIKQCRLVVTGSYHGAVFSLAQGIPAICIANSTYYVNKFLGLKDFYKEGCEVILADDMEFSEKLITAMETLWKDAENLRSDLLSSSIDLISKGRSTYLKLYESLSQQT